MGPKIGIKWEKSTLCRPVHNIISSDFPKFNPQPWKLTEGPPRIALLLSYEYQRMWAEELDVWKKRLYPENTTDSVDVVKSYVANFKSHVKDRTKPDKNKPKIEKSEGKKKQPPKNETEKPP